MSGDGQAPEYDEPEAMRAHLIAPAPATSGWSSIQAGLDTYDSCVRARDSSASDLVVVVTQSYHLPRAVGTARLLGLAGSGRRPDRPRRRGRRLNEPW